MAMTQPPPQPAAESRSERPRRWPGRLLIALLSTVFMLAGTAGFLVGTETGLRVLAGLSQRAWPGTLAIGQVEGSLWKGAVLHRVRVHVTEADVEIRRLSFGWQPGRLRQGELHIDSLRAEDTDLTLRAASPAAEQAPALPTVSLPIRLILDALVLERLRIQPPEGEPAVLERVEMAVDWQGHDLSLTRLALAISAPARAEMRVGGKLALRDRYPLTADIQWRLEAQPAPIAGEGRVEGDLSVLRIRHRSSGGVVSHVDAELFDVVDALRWRAEAGLDEVPLQAFGGGLPQGILSARVTSEGSLEALTAVAEVEASMTDLVDLGALLAKTELNLEGDVLEVRALTLAATQSEASVSGQGRVLLGAAEGPSLDLKLQWRDLAWPLQGEPQYQSPEGSLALAGRADDYSHELDLRLAGRDIPSTTLRARGRGDTTALSLDSLALALLDGNVTGAGQVRWDPELAWNLDLKADGLAPQVQWPELEGRIGFSARGEGRHTGGNDMALEIAELSGELNGRPIAGGARGRWRADILSLDQVDLTAGPNRLSVNGGIGERLDLDVSIDAPDVSVLHPAWHGALMLDAAIGGTTARPDLDGRLSVTELRMADVRLAGAQGRVRVAAAPTGVLDVDLTADTLAVGSLRWDKAALTAKGTPAEHLVEVSLEGRPLSIGGAVKGALGDRNGYAGSVERLKLDVPGPGTWQLTKAAAFAVGSDNWQLAQACLASAGGLGEACVEADGDSVGAWRLVADVPRLGLGILEPFLPEGLALEGEVRMKADMRSDGSRLDGAARLEVPSGISRVDLDKGDQALDFSGTVLEVVAKGENVEASLELPFGGLGRMQGTAMLRQWRMDAPTRPEQPVEAYLQGKISDLSPLMAVMPQLAAVEGAINVDLALTGTLGSSALNGEIRLDGGGFDIPAGGVTVRELRLVARSRAAGELELEGRAKLGDGEVLLDGRAKTVAKGLSAQVTLKGDRLTVVDIPEAMVVVTPDLAFTLEPGRAQLTGELLVPEARLRPRSLPEGSVSPSSDVVIKGQETNEPTLRLITATDVRLQLGDRVSFEGFGLRGLFRGNLRVTQEPRRLALGNGQLSIHEGTFDTFGEELTIEQGRLVFANTPVYDPGVNIVAKREFSEATVGARVAGTLKKPSVTFFADPPMGQAEALNYLITGGASRGTGVSGASVVGGNLIVKELGRRVGLDDVGVTQSEDSENLSVYVGTYLNPKLYMQYVSELGEKADKIRLRYDLTKKIQLEAETGDVQSADVFYSFER